ncbi:DUF2157 domain-containing protein [Chitinophaga sp. Mgbs1]|uniref:DUF2157 domain-containing protein n=1 Tax=Chitinophaga solisilvae TaxID=1233460 RepID=A0A3S1JAD8_9BACT|nr:DUF2157 domain-containing protein [Chitinophaga solisilvae]
MNIHLFKKLYQENLIDATALEKMETANRNRLFSLHWEIKTILYLGVLLLSGGLGILVYKNLDTIGHQIIIVLLAAVSIAGFTYCYKQKAPFSYDKVESPNAFFDYALLLGCLTFVTFIGYLQFQYGLFGSRYGLATFVPMAVLFFSAYYFDHLGVLSLAITNLAAWAGITVSLRRILYANDFSNHTLTYTALLLGAGLYIAGILSEQKKIKPHFAFTYQNFGAHIFFIAACAAIVVFENTYMLWFLLAAGAGALVIRHGFRLRSFYFVLIAVLYMYVALTITIGCVLYRFADIDAILLALFYLIASATGIIILLIHLNKKIKS